MNKAKLSISIKKILQTIDRSESVFDIFETQEKIAKTFFRIKKETFVFGVGNVEFNSKLKNLFIDDRIEFFSFCLIKDNLKKENYFSYFSITNNWDDRPVNQLDYFFSAEEKEKVFEYWKKRIKVIKKNVFLKLHYFNLLIYFGYGKKIKGINKKEIKEIIDFIMNDVFTKSDKYWISLNPKEASKIQFELIVFEKLSLIKRVLQLAKRIKNYDYKKIKNFLFNGIKKFSKIKELKMRIKLHLRGCREINCSKDIFCKTGIYSNFPHLAFFYWLYIDKKIRFQLNDNVLKIKDLEEIIVKNNFKSEFLSTEDDYLFEKELFLIFESLLNKNFKKKEELPELLNKKFKILFLKTETNIKNKEFNSKNDWIKEIVFLFSVCKVLSKQFQEIDLSNFYSLINELNDKYISGKAVDFNDLFYIERNEELIFAWNQKKISNQNFIKNHVKETKIKIQNYSEKITCLQERFFKIIDHYNKYYISERKFHMIKKSRIEFDIENHRTNYLIIFLNELVGDFKEILKIQNPEEIIVFLKKQKVFKKINEIFWFLEKAIYMFFKKEYYISSKMFVDFYSLLISKITKENKINIWKTNDNYEEKNISSIIHELHKKMCEESFNNWNDKNQSYLKIVFNDYLLFLFSKSFLNLRNRYAHPSNIKELKEPYQANLLFFVSCVLFTFDENNFFW